MRRRATGRDEAFRDTARAAAGGVVLGEQPPGPPPRTVTQVTFQGCQMGLMRLTNNDNEVVGYEIKVMDPVFNTVYTYPLAPEQGVALLNDFNDLIHGTEEGAEQGVHEDQMQIGDE